MTIRTIIRMGNPILRQIAIPLSKQEILSSDIQTLIQDLHETMQANQGIGIAAPQVGVSKQLAIVGISELNQRYPDAKTIPLQVIINPVIEIINTETQGYWEGCLSVPGLRGYVERPQHIKVQFLNEKARLQVLELEGFAATVFQHEIDHLFGKLYIDNIKDSTLLSFNAEYLQFHAPKE